MNALLSLDGRTVRRAAVSLFGVAMLAACDSDRVVAPRNPSAKAPTPATSDVQVSRGSIGIHAMGPNGWVPSTKYTILAPNLTLATAEDNGPGDDDGFTGIISLRDLPLGTYYVCQVEVPSIYELDHEPCRNVTVYVNSTTRVDYFSAPMVSASWDVRDWYGKLMGNTTFKVTGGRGLGNVTISDNGANDLDDRLGHLTVQLPKAAVYTLCQTKATAGHYIASPACKQVDDTSGRGVWVGTFVEPDAQVVSTP